MVVPGQMVHRIYGNAIMRQRSFCYLGMDISSSGIRAKEHVARRILKAEKLAAGLGQVGARFKGFPVKVNVSLYQVFIRPGLEYGLPLICSNKVAINKLDCCQKRILCKFLGVDTIARNIIVYAMTNCPPFDVRSDIIRAARMERLIKVIDEDGWESHALAYVLRCTQVEPFIDRSVADRTRSQILTSFRAKLDEDITGLYDGFLDRVALRWLLNMPFSPGIMRTILLWILGRWNCFSLRRCQHCGIQFQNQGHVIDCSCLIRKLGDDPGLVGLTQPTQINPRWVIEFYLGEIRHSPLEGIPNYVSVLETRIRESIRLVFGDSY